MFFVEIILLKLLMELEGLGIKEYSLIQKRPQLTWLTVVNNNSAFRQCLDTINAVYGEKPSNKDEICKFSNVSFEKIAEDIGCVGIRVEHPNGISGALKKALAANGPSGVEVVTGMEYGAPKPWEAQRAN